MSDRDLRAPIRKQTVGAGTMQQNLFPFDAFEMDRARTASNPQLSVKSPWELGCIHNLTGSPTLNDADLIMIYDVSESRYMKMTIGELRTHLGL